MHNRSLMSLINFHCSPLDSGLCLGAIFHYPSDQTQVVLLEVLSGFLNNALQIQQLSRNTIRDGSILASRSRARLDAEVNGGRALSPGAAAGAEGQARGVQSVGGQRGEAQPQHAHHLRAPRCARSCFLEQRQLQHRARVEYWRMHLHGREDRHLNNIRGSDYTSLTVR